MFCRNCGRKLLPDSNFCDNCGIEVASKEEAHSSYRTTPKFKSAATTLDAEENPTWFISFIGWGFIAGLPIPLVFWLCVIPGVWLAARNGWPRGLYGMGLWLVLAILVRSLIAGSLSMTLPEFP